jgi:hypothetical protein
MKDSAAVSPGQIVRMKTSFLKHHCTARLEADGTSRISLLVSSS